MYNYKYFFSPNGKRLRRPGTRGTPEVLEVRYRPLGDVVVDGDSWGMDLRSLPHSAKHNTSVISNRFSVRS